MACEVGGGGAGGEVGGGTGIGMQKQNNKLINNKKGLR